MLRLRLLVGALVLGALGCSSSEDGGGDVLPFTPGQPAVNPGQQPAPGAAGAAAMPAGPIATPESPAEGNPNVTSPPAAAEGPGAVGAPVAAQPDAGPVVTAPPVETPTTGVPLPVVPSAGCGSPSAPAGAGALTIRGQQAEYVVTLPSGYSPDTPAPLVFAFHGRNRTHVELMTIDAGGIQTELGSRAVMVYMKSQGGPGWNFPEEVPPSIEFFEALYPQMFDSYCVDLSKVYAVGHSSGGYFSIILACRYGSLLRGIGSVAGALQEDMCSSEQVAGMFIHGATDTVVANSGGRAARDQLLARNACTQNTVAGAVAPCVAYQGCAEGFPVEWCEHTEPTYLQNNQPTNHGWPSFASRAINQFFLSLP